MTHTRHELLLNICNTDRAFWTRSGQTIRSIPQLVVALSQMTDEEFSYHVNADHNKNDFADWIRDVYDEAELSIQLEGVYYKGQYEQIITRFFFAIASEHKHDA